MPKILGHLGIEKLVLAAGGHGSRESGVCAMEAVAWFAGEPHSDAPMCTCPVIGAYVRRTNDWLTAEERQLLIDLIPALVGTRSTLNVEIKRAQFLAGVAKNVFANAAAADAARSAAAARYAADAAWAADSAASAAYDDDADADADVRTAIVTAAIKAIVDIIEVGE